MNINLKGILAWIGILVGASGVLYDGFGGQSGIDYPYMAISMLFALLGIGLLRELKLSPKRNQHPVCLYIKYLLAWAGMILGGLGVLGALLTLDILAIFSSGLLAVLGLALKEELQKNYITLT